MTIQNILPIVILGVVAAYCIIHEFTDQKLINKAAKGLGVPNKLVPFFQCELLSLYKHQPMLKTVQIADHFWLLVTSFDYQAYKQIQEKQERLLSQVEEYGDVFALSTSQYMM